MTESAEKYLLMLSTFRGRILNDSILGLLSFLSMFGDEFGLDSDSSSIVVVFIVTLFVNLLYYQSLV